MKKFCEHITNAIRKKKNNNREEVCETKEKKVEPSLQQKKREIFKKSIGWETQKKKKNRYPFTSNPPKTYEEAFFYTPFSI